MQMKLRIHTDELNAALGEVSIVTPKPVTENGQAGYLFVIEGQKCHIQSWDSQHVARATINVVESSGDFSFVYPASAVDSFKFLSGDITFDVTDDNDTYLIKYDAGNTDERTSISPKYLEHCAKALAEAPEGHVFNVNHLREAISAARPFLPKPNEERTREHFKTLQMFEPSRPEWEKGNGHIFATNASKALFYYCDGFKGKGLAVYGTHLGVLQAFLSKVAGEITVRHGNQMTYAVARNGDYVLGWAHTKALHERFTYYGLKQDQIVLSVPVSVVLTQLNWSRAALDMRKDRVKVIYDKDHSTLQVQLSESSHKGMSLPVVVKTAQNDLDKGFSFNVSLNNFIDMFSGLVGHDVQLRVYIMPATEQRPKEGAAFRTIDEFYVDDAGKTLAVPTDPEAKLPENAVKCRVTRYMSSMM